MSGAGTAAKPPRRFCWACSRQLQGNFHRIVKTPDGHEVAVHADCAKRDGLDVVPGKHLATKAHVCGARIDQPRGTWERPPIMFSCPKHKVEPGVACPVWDSREDIAAAAAVPVDWVPAEWATLTDDEIADRVQARLDAEYALRRSPLYALVRSA